MLDQIKNKHLLVDGDIYKYRCAASAEKTKYLVEDYDSNGFGHYDTHKEAVAASGDLGTIWSRKEVQPVEHALQAVKTGIDSLIAKLNPAKVSIYLSPDRTFRHQLATTRPYKGNRTAPKPKYLKDCEGYLIREYGATIADNREADDEIGIALSRDRDGAVSVSIDKDLLQVPGWHYDWVNDRVQRVSPKEADLHFYSQMLTGDATDNIPGLSGHGPSAAERILKGVVSRADAASRVWSCYRGEFNTTDAARDYFLEQAQLLWILRDEERFGGSFRGYFPPIELK